MCQLLCEHAAVVSNTLPQLKHLKKDLLPRNFWHLAVNCCSKDCCTSCTHLNTLNTEDHKKKHKFPMRSFSIERNKYTQTASLVKWTVSWNWGFGRATVLPAKTYFFGPSMLLSKILSSLFMYSENNVSCGLTVLRVRSCLRNFGNRSFST